MHREQLPSLKKFQFVNKFVALVLSGSVIGIAVHYGSFTNNVHIRFKMLDSYAKMYGANLKKV